MQTYLDFEKPIAELETRVAELRETASSSATSTSMPEVGRLETKADKLLRDTYAKLTPWQKAQVARHPDRPHFKDYVAGIAEDFLPLAGDRAFADDPAIIGGLARIDGRRVMLIGHEKGDDTASRLRHNFGMAKPEGYRKAIRLMRLADRFGVPVVTLVDTPGAFPGVAGRGARPGRSDRPLDRGMPGARRADGRGDRRRGRLGRRGRDRQRQPRADVRACGLFGDFARRLRVDPVAHRRQGRRAAEAMKITAADLQALGVIDRIVAEPLGGAHRDPEAAIGALKGALIEELDGCGKLGPRRVAGAAPRQVPRHRLRASTTHLPVIPRSKSPRLVWRRTGDGVAVMRKTILLLAAAALAFAPAAAQRAALSRSPGCCRSAARQCGARPGARRRGNRAARRLCRKRSAGASAAYSGIANPGQALHFTTLNSAVENAFSVPGGYVYITRQLMGLMDDESELAFALGHEVGHIAANHAHTREQYAQRSSAGLYRPGHRRDLRPGFGDILERRARSSIVLSFSREQEYQADTLGIRYMIAAGYDPAGRAGMLAALSRASALEARVQGQRQPPDAGMGEHPSR